MTDNTEPNLDSIINLFISKINANEQTSNYIFDEDYVAVAELKRDFEGYIANQIREARLDELEHLFDRADGERSARRYTAILEQRIKVLRTRLNGVKNK